MRGGTIHNFGALSQSVVHLVHTHMMRVAVRERCEMTHSLMYGWFRPPEVWRLARKRGGPLVPPPVMIPREAPLIPWGTRTHSGPLR